MHTSSLIFVAVVLLQYIIDICGTMLGSCSIFVIIYWAFVRKYARSGLGKDSERSFSFFCWGLATS